MPKGGNHHDKYEMKRRTDGRLCLSPPLHDVVAKLLAEGEERSRIPALLSDEITLEQIEELETQVLFQRRVDCLRRQLEKDEYEPQTPDECLKFVKQSLVRLAKNAAEDKSKIDALKALASVANEERKSGRADAPPPSQDGDLDKLKEAFGGAE